MNSLLPLTFTGYLSLADKENGDYVYIPFSVPPGIARIDVRYTYSHPRHHGDFDGQGNTIDIGLFDAHGCEFLDTKGFRGWSGSDRKHVWVGATDADTAPGYLSGPIPEGTWHVILGLYRIADEGCDWTVTVEFSVQTGSAASNGEVQRLEFSPSSSPVVDPSESPLLSQGERSKNPSHLRGEGWDKRQSTAYQWYRGDLQSHTHHSDGKGSLTTLVATARARGLDFLAVTDHNTISHIREYDTALQAPISLETKEGPEVGAGLLLIPATEVTTYYGHMNVWGLRDMVDFRCGDPHAMAQIIEAAHAQGALASVNHPKTGGPQWEYGGDLPFDCIEVWQAPWPFYNTESFGWWESLLLQGRRIIAVGGSDYHQPLKVMEGNPHLPGHPTTWVYASSLTTDAILDGIRRGHVFISADVDGPVLYLTGSVPASFSFSGRTVEDEGGRGDYLPGDVVEHGVASLHITCEIHGAAGYFARLIADGGVVAELPIDSADWRHTWQAQPRATHYLRAEVIIRPTGGPDWVMAACSNPLYF